MLHRTYSTSPHGQKNALAAVQDDHAISELLLAKQIASLLKIWLYFREDFEQKLFRRAFSMP